MPGFDAVLVQYSTVLKAADSEIMEARGPDSKLEVGSNVPISSGGTFESLILVKLTGSSAVGLRL